MPSLHNILSLWFFVNVENGQGWIILAIGSLLLNCFLIMRLTLMNYRQSSSNAPQWRFSLGRHIRELESQLEAERNKVHEMEERLLADRLYYEKELEKYHKKDSSN